RFDQSLVFDELAKAGRLSASSMIELTGHIAAFHQSAERRPDHGGAAALAAVVETNHGCLTAAREAGFSAERIAQVRQGSLDRLGEDDGLPAMPLFLSSRAAIRAHVTATALERTAGSGRRPAMAAEARSYLDLAVQFLRPRSCRLVAIGGLSGTGKSTLAAALAPSLGARVLRSDVIRKQLFGVALETRLPAGAYVSQAPYRVSDALGRQASDCLDAGL